MQRIPFSPHPYDTLVPKLREFFPEMVYDKACEQLLNIEDATFEHIEYDSDGLNITGALAIPQNTGKKHPLIIFNRGGSRNYGMLTAPVLLRNFHRYTQRGYIVIGSNYRGNDGSDGVESFGGDDVNDVINLAQYAEQVDEWDGKNIFLYGWSRGGMMTYRALQEGIIVNAAVSVAGVADIHALDVFDKSFMQRVVPHMVELSDAERLQAFDERSATKWASDINTPLLLLHGDADTVVPAQQSIALSEQLKNHNKPYEIVIYEGGDHTLKRHKKEVDDTADTWFQKHLKN